MPRHSSMGLKERFSVVNAMLSTSGIEPNLSTRQRYKTDFGDDLFKDENRECTIKSVYNHLT